MKTQKTTHRRYFTILTLLAAFVVQVGLLEGIRADESAKVFDPPTLYATWSADPTTTMDIMWLVPHLGEAGVGAVYYREKGQTKAEWVRSQGKFSPFPYTESIMFRSHLQGLKPDTEYEFRFEASKQYPETRIYSFRTMPAKLDRPLRFAFGGDMGVTKEAFKVSHAVMTHDPDFILIGGDLAYTNAAPTAVTQELAWLKLLKDCFISPSGRLTPILAAIGNHETANSKDYSSAHPLEKASYYYVEFPFPGIPAYGAIDFGNYMSIIMLEAHTIEIGGVQTEWLAKALEARKDVPYVFPVYHVPQYPVYRDFEGEWSAAQRKHWGPLFEKYGIRVAFENHDHAYKRTYPLRDGKVVSDDLGITYIGDGAWGVQTRPVKADRWYLAKALQENYFGIATLEPSQNGKGQSFRMYNADNKLIDSYPEK